MNMGLQGGGSWTQVTVRKPIVRDCDGCLDSERRARHYLGEFGVLPVSTQFFVPDTANWK